MVKFKKMYALTIENFYNFNFYQIIEIYSP